MLVVQILTELGLLQGEITDFSDLFFEVVSRARQSRASLILTPYIARQGLTVFNHLQMGAFLIDLEILKRHVLTQLEIELLVRIERLARRCEGDYGLFLQFSGSAILAAN